MKECVFFLSRLSEDHIKESRDVAELGSFCAEQAQRATSNFKC